MLWAAAHLVVAHEEQGAVIWDACQALLHTTASSSGEEDRADQPPDGGHIRPAQRCDNPAEEERNTPHPATPGPPVRFVVHPSAVKTPVTQLQVRLMCRWHAVKGFRT